MHPKSLGTSEKGAPGRIAIGLMGAKNYPPIDW